MHSYKINAVVSILYTRHTSKGSAYIKVVGLVVDDVFVVLVQMSVSYQ